MISLVFCFFFPFIFLHLVDDIRMQFRMHHQWPGKLSFESNAVVFSVSGQQSFRLVGIKLGNWSRTEWNNRSNGWSGTLSWRSKPSLHYQCQSQNRPTKTETVSIHVHFFLKEIEKISSIATRFIKSDDDDDKCRKKQQRCSHNFAFIACHIISRS